MACEEKCRVSVGRSVYWCGYSNTEPGTDVHDEHDWYSYVYGAYQHCYGTTEGE